MGAWGVGAFQNDAALDWLAELEADGVGALRRVLTRVANTDADEDLDADDGSAAIAAAELVAATLPSGRDRLTKRARSWLDANAIAIEADDVGLARRAVERVLGAESELRALWDENGPDTEWHDGVRVLLDRLG
jgi:hypothetical protein